MSTKPRVRFAPSPTGYLHIGGVRTALFNWLWARKTAGTFVLRIEDTDRERSTDESVRVILDAMTWLGLTWDEGPGVGGPNGPYFQTERLALYAEYAEKLIASGHAFRCTCTKEELDEQRAALKAKDPKANFRYPGTCHDRPSHPGAPSVVRFRAPTSGVTSYEDLVFGHVSTPNAAQQDFVLLRTDGVPLYNFGCVVDDLSMGITMVARGRDHMVNTPPQLLLYEALGAKAPQFAHLPMMLAPSGEKLSKRHGAVSVGEYRAMGYSPMGVLNYLVRFGWSHGDQEIFSRDELVAAFDWASCGKSDGKFDPKKYADVAFEHLKRDELTPAADYARAVRPFLADLGVDAPEESTLLAAIPAVRERSRTLKDAAESLVYFFREPVFDEKAKAKFLVPEQADKLAATLAIIDDDAAWRADGVPALAALLEARLVAGLAERGLALKDVGQPVRVALSGRGVSPPLHETMALLGRERTVARLTHGLAVARGS